MPTERTSSVVFLSTVLTFAIIGVASLVYFVMADAFQAVIRALSILPH